MNRTDDFEKRFRRTCPFCGARLAGFLIRQLLLDPPEVHYMIPQATERTIRRWMREWCPLSSGVLPTRRAPAVDARELALALEAHKSRLGVSSAASRPARVRLQTKCSNCGAALGGFVARFAFRDLREVVPQIGAGIIKDSVRRWIRRGLLRAYRLPGIRGALFDQLEFEQDFAAVRAKYLRVTRLVARSPHDEEEDIG